MTKIINFCGLKIEVRTYGLESAMEKIHQPDRKLEKNECVDCMERKEYRTWRKCKNFDTKK